MQPVPSMLSLPSMHPRAHPLRTLCAKPFECGGSSIDAQIVHNAGVSRPDLTKADKLLKKHVSVSEIAQIVGPAHGSHPQVHTASVCSLLLFFSVSSRLRPRCVESCVERLETVCSSRCTPG